MPARALLRQSHKQYDMVIIDLFFDPTSTSDHLITREFFEQVKAKTKGGGMIVGNFFGSPSFTDPLSKTLDTTLHSVFPYLNRQVIHKYNAWDNKAWDNIVYSAVNIHGNTTIYTDAKNKAMFDRPTEVK